MAVTRPSGALEAEFSETREVMGRNVVSLKVSIAPPVHARAKVNLFMFATCSRRFCTHVLRSSLPRWLSVGHSFHAPLRAFVFRFHWVVPP